VQHGIFKVSLLRPRLHPYWLGIHFIISRPTLSPSFSGSVAVNSTPTLTSLAPTTLQDSTNEGEGTPSPTLSARDLPQAQSQHHGGLTNTCLSKDRHIHLSLINSAWKALVIASPQSLYSLDNSLKEVGAPTGLD